MSSARPSFQACVLVLSLFFFIFHFKILHKCTLHMWTCVHIFRCWRRPEQPIVPWMLSTLFLPRCVTLGNAPSRLECLSVGLSAKPLGTTYLYFSNTGITSTHHHAWHFYMDSEKSNSDLCNHFTKLAPNPTLQHLKIGLLWKLADKISTI